MTQSPHPSLPGEVSESDAIHLEASPFEAGYQPGSLPRFSVPDLPEDAQGLSAEALAKVPTLTELVNHAADEPVVPKHREAQSAPPIAPEEAEQTQALATQNLATAGLEAQDKPAQADLWSEELQVRIGKLADDIHILNARLDRLEEFTKLKV